METVLAFWFGVPGSDGYGEPQERWFKKDPAFDAQIRDKYLPLMEAAVIGDLDDWAGVPDGALALILLFDQFPRNVYRDDPKAFETDAMARETANLAISLGFDQEMPPFMRTFFYLPFEHSENLADQDRSVALFKAMGNDGLVKWAVAHRDIILRFGRFPHRNAILNRKSTPEEDAFLKEPNSSF